MDYKHYIRLNENDLIIKSFSTAFEQPQEGDILICESNERHFNMDLYDDNMIPKYQYIDNQIVLRQDMLEIQLNNVKNNKINELNIKCSQEIEKGILCITNNHFYRYNKEEDQSNFAAQFLEILDGTAPEIINWKSEDVGIIPLSQNEFKSIYRELGNNQKTLIAKYWGLKYQVLNATTLQEVMQIVW